MTLAKPIIQHFLGHPVRVFRTEFQVEMTPRYTGSSDQNMRPHYENSSTGVRPHHETQPRSTMRGRNNPPSGVEMRGHNAPSSPRIFSLDTYAIPFPDFCRALDRPEKDIRRMIQLSEEVFAGLYRTEVLPDALGRLQSTILMAQEMVDGLVMKIHTSRIQDPETRARVVEFQRFVMLTIGLIRRKKILPAHDGDLARIDVPAAYQNLLTLRSSQELAEAVRQQAVAEGKSVSTVYRKMSHFRGSNVITQSGLPRKRRAR